ncbi:unnamed protein product [Trichobilharzia szidati]|nr:unnamed protein product [Trichobilharzia szidati]
MSNFSLVTTSNITQQNANNTANHPTFNNLFQSLLSASTSQQASMPPANVTGYVNTIASGQNGNLFTSFRPAQLTYQSNNIRITLPTSVSLVSPHVTVNSNALRSSNPTSSHNNMNNGTQSTITTTAATATTTTKTTTATTTGRFSKAMSTESLFVSTNLIPCNGMKKLGAMTFLRWAAACTHAFRKDRISVWPKSKVDIDALHEMNWLISPPGLLGIYSESPFLRPAVLLRRVQFAAPGSINPNIPDVDNMVRTLREMADAKATKYSRFAPHFPSSAASVGFTTDYMTYIFTLELERQVVRLLLRSKNIGHSNWRVVLRLGWATTDFYVPGDTSSNSASHRAIVPESLPRCLSVRVGGRVIPLPDPIFHGGQAQRLGKRLRMSIDITEKVLMKCNSGIRNKVVDIELTWLHAPLEDQTMDLLSLLADGLVSPLLCHLVGLPLVQVTLDRVYTVADLRNIFSPGDPDALKKFIEGPVLDDTNFPPLTTNSDDSGPLEHHGVYGIYDSCLPPECMLRMENTKLELKSRFEKNDDSDNDVIIGDGDADGDVEAADYIPICLLCPLTRTRIEIPVRSHNCSHLQCFDLSSYLTMNLRRPRWTCPICSTHSPFRDLRVDELFMSIIQDPRSANLEFVHVDSNGDWHLNSFRSTNAAPTASATATATVPTTNDSHTDDKCPPATQIKSTDDDAASNNNQGDNNDSGLIETDSVVKEDKTESGGGGDGESGNSPEKSQSIMNESKETVTSVDSLEATTNTTATTTTTTSPTATTTSTTGVRENRHSEEPIVIILSDDDDDVVNENEGAGGEKNEEGHPSSTHSELRNDNENRNSTDKLKSPVRNHSVPHTDEKVNGITPIPLSKYTTFEIDLTNDDSSDSSLNDDTPSRILDKVRSFNKQHQQQQQHQHHRQQQQQRNRHPRHPYTIVPLAPRPSQPPQPQQQLVINNSGEVGQQPLFNSTTTTPSSSSSSSSTSTSTSSSESSMRTPDQQQQHQQHHPLHQQLSLCTKGDPLIVISPLPAMSVASAISGSLRIDDEIDMHLMNQYNSLRNELSKDANKQLSLLNDNNSNSTIITITTTSTNSNTNTTITTTNDSGSSTGAGASTGAGNWSMLSMPSFTTTNDALLNSLNPESEFYKHLLEVTADRVNQTLLKHNSSMDNNTTNTTNSSSGANKRKSNLSSSSYSKRIDNRTKSTSKKIVLLDSDDEMIDAISNSIPTSPTTTTTTHRRNAHIVKMQQVTALARLIQERSRRIKPSTETSKNQNQSQSLEASSTVDNHHHHNHPSTSYTTSSSNSSRTVQKHNNTLPREPSPRRRTRPLRQNRRKSRIEPIDSENSSCSSTSDACCISEMSCISESGEEGEDDEEEAASRGSSFSGSQFTDEDDDDDDDDDDISIESFSSDDRWSPSREYTSNNKKQTNKRKPTKVRR